MHFRNTSNGFISQLLVWPKVGLSAQSAAVEVDLQDAQSTSKSGCSNRLQQEAIMSPKPVKDICPKVWSFSTPLGVIESLSWKESSLRWEESWRGIARSRRDLAIPHCRGAASTANSRQQEPKSRQRYLSQSLALFQASRRD